MLQFAIDHYVLIGIVLFVIYSNAVSAMPTPDANSSKAYKFWFAFLHSIACNLGRIQAIRELLGSGTADKPSS